MKYKRTFKLKDYWNKFFQGTDNETRKIRRTDSITWDGINWVFGGNSFIIPPKLVKRFIDEDLDKIYHRNKVGLKVFYLNKYPLNASMEDCSWGNEPGYEKGLVESTKIQNIFAVNRLAPRVYDLVFLKNGIGLYPTQVIEYIEDDGSNKEKARKRIIDHTNRLGIIQNDLDNTQHIISGMTTDFECCKFGSYKDDIIEKIKRGLAYGGDTVVPYQSVEELGIVGNRNNSIRETKLKVNKKLLPKDFTVLDFGCNGGYFLRKAMDMGASYGMGIDVARVVETNREMFPYLGYFNVDFKVSETHDPRLPDIDFDLVFLLSMNAYIHSEAMFKSTKRVIYMESHNMNNEHTEDKYFNMLKPYFKKVKLLGYYTDEEHQPPRMIFEGIK